MSRGLTLASSVLAGRLLGTTGFGEIGMIQSTQGLFGIVAGAGLGLAATKFVAESRSIDPARTGRCVTLATTIALISGTLMARCSCLLSGAIASSVLNAPHLTVELQVATALVLFGTVNGVQTGALVGFGDFRTLAVLYSIRGVCLCVFMIAGIKLGGVLGGVIGLVLTEAIAVLTIGAGGAFGGACHRQARFVGRCIGSVVREGVHIGSDVMIGAGSVVLHDIPDGVLAYGVPARVVRQTSPAA